MKPFYFTIFCFLLFNHSLIGQTEEGSKKSTEMSAAIPYHQIPEYPAKMTAGTGIARVIDGLGYRYYWATKDLTSKDLNYEPGNEGRKSEDVLDHLYGLSIVIKNATQNAPNIRPAPASNLAWEDKRVATLKNFQVASDKLKSSTDEEVANFSIIFKRGEQENKVSVWHLMNGPIADAIYHVGQIVSYRRSAGNPMNPFVNVFTGKTRE
jgi:uncharacterized damage-inducible protein DinB